MMHIYNNTQPKYDWLFNTHSRVLQDDWMILENDEKASLNIKMPIWSRHI